MSSSQRRACAGLPHPKRVPLPEACVCHGLFVLIRTSKRYASTRGRSARDRIHPRGLLREFPAARGNFHRQATGVPADGASRCRHVPGRCDFVQSLDGPIIALRTRGECLCSRISLSSTHPRRADGVGSGIDSRGSPNPISRRVCGYAYDSGALVAPWLTRNAPSANAGSRWTRQERHLPPRILFRGGGCSANDPTALRVRRPGTGRGRGVNCGIPRRETQIVAPGIVTSVVI
jgi:hypothetical protein